MEVWIKDPFVADSGSEGPEAFQAIRNDTANATSVVNTGVAAAQS